MLSLIATGTPSSGRPAARSRRASSSAARASAPLFVDVRNALSWRSACAIRSSAAAADLDAPTRGRRRPRRGCPEAVSGERSSAEHPWYFEEAGGAIGVGRRAQRLRRAAATGASRRRAAARCSASGCEVGSTPVVSTSLQLFGVGEDAGELAREQLAFVGGQLEPRQRAMRSTSSGAEDVGDMSPAMLSSGSGLERCEAEARRSAVRLPVGLRPRQRSRRHADPTRGGRRTWYPGTAGALTREVDALSRRRRRTWTGGPIRAIIAPHAGLMFSGPVGAYAYKAAAARRATTSPSWSGPRTSSRSTASRSIRTARSTRRSATGRDRRRACAAGARGLAGRPGAAGRARARTLARDAAAVPAAPAAGRADRAAADGFQTRETIWRSPSALARRLPSAARCSSRAPICRTISTPRPPQALDAPRAATRRRRSIPTGCSSCSSSIRSASAAGTSPAAAGRRSP